MADSHKSTVSQLSEPDTNSTKNFPIQIVDSATKHGVGIIASRDIEKNELVFAECPVLRVALANDEDSSLIILTDDEKIWVDGYCRATSSANSSTPSDPVKTFAENSFKKVKIAFSEIQNQSEKDAIFALHDVFSAGENSFSFGKKTLFGIYQTNCLSDHIQTSDNETGVLCPIASRFNHSCTPNLFVFPADEGTNSSSSSSSVATDHPGTNNSSNFCEQRFFATRDIKAGEELFHSYVDPEAPRNERRNTLEKAYRFVDDDSGATNYSKDSDSRRMRIRELRKQLVSTEEDKEEAEISAQSKLQNSIPELFDLLRLEKLENPFTIATISFYAFDLARIVGDFEAAKMWIDKAISNFKILSLGIESEQILELKELRDIFP
mmetsp:Transcript_25902/g.29621  ORF Transcript_25902/g.29621 Transcript_25902/m.29621 type:complete len:380 (+) Transcript_25902:23-1162(+)